MQYSFSIRFRAPHVEIVESPLPEMLRTLVRSGFPKTQMIGVPAPFFCPQRSGYPAGGALFTMTTTGFAFSRAALFGFRRMRILAYSLDPD